MAIGDPVAKDRSPDGSTMIPARTSSTTAPRRALGATSGPLGDGRSYAGMTVSPARSSHTGRIDTGFAPADAAQRRRQQRASDRRRARRERMRRVARHMGWWLAWQTRPTQ